MRRRLGLLLLAGVLVACGGDDQGSGSATTAAGRESTTTSANAPAATTTVPTRGGATGGVSTAGGTADGGGPSTTTAPRSSSLSPGGVGDLAGALLRPGNGDRIVVEVRAQAGAAPRAATLQHLVGVLHQVSGKAVAVDGVDPLAGGARDWTSASIAAAADHTGAHGQGGTQVVVRLLFVHGTFEGDESVLGVSVRGDVAAIFTDQVDAASGLLSDPAVVEDAVTMHESGHLLGLVDLAIDTGRDDPQHPGHSTDERSVMYWAVESDLIGEVLGGGIPTDFDARDRADLARIRAG
ncbi:MAG: hypothetical protein ACJ739_09580 [Acidimicrobiales bacterium]